MMKTGTFSNLVYLFYIRRRNNRSHHACEGKEGEVVEEKAGAAIDVDSKVELRIDFFFLFSKFSLVITGHRYVGKERHRSGISPRQNRNKYLKREANHLKYY